MRNASIQLKIPSLSLVHTAFLLVALMFLASGCQEESEDITPPPADKVITANSAVANYIAQITLKDGSSDNIIDHASCLTLVLPVTVIVNQQQVTIDSASEFSVVEKILDELENDDDTVNIIFPVTVTLADHTEVVVQNHDQFEDLADDCTEGGNDDDIECVDFKYPFSISVYDSRNQLARTVTINSDEDLYRFFDTLGDDEFASFQFPLTVIVGGESEITSNTNDQLKDLIESEINACDEDDDYDHNDDDADDTEFISVLLSGDWQVTSFIDETDQTVSFQDYTFTFNSDSTILATDGVSSTQGVWETNGDDGTIELELNLGELSPFDKINEDWAVVEYGNAQIKLQHVSEEDGSVATLVFEKN
ncbi:MAG TPA: hypothetical protein VFO54_09280 [Chryseosolibacter sp.]|nr:hypothetical protein [Chryseosolibacter sp.]